MKPTPLPTPAKVFYADLMRKVLTNDEGVEYKADWLTQSQDGKEMVEGKDFGINLFDVAVPLPTQADVVEGNKLIGEFYFGDNPGLKAHYVKEGKPNPYHDSWAWLMPVVEKINVTDTPLGRMDVIIYRTTCHINDPMQILIETTSNGSLIECVWQAVVQFIEWYNNQKLKP